MPSGVWGMAHIAAKQPSLDGPPVAQIRGACSNGSGHKEVVLVFLLCDEVAFGGHRSGQAQSSSLSSGRKVAGPEPAQDPDILRRGDCPARPDGLGG